MEPQNQEPLNAPFLNGLFSSKISRGTCNGPLGRNRGSPIKVGKRPIKEGKRPIKAMVLVGISVGCLMSCFRAPPPWRKTAPLKWLIKRSMTKIAAIFHLRQKISIAIAEKSRHLVHSAEDPSTQDSHHFRRGTHSNGGNTCFCQRSLKGKELLHGEKGRKTAKTHPESTFGRVLLGWVLWRSLKLFMGLSQEYPWIVPGLSRHFPEISWEFCFCVSLFTKKRATPKQFDPYPFPGPGQSRAVVKSFIFCPRYELIFSCT